MLETRWCHASCCMGETEITDIVWTVHDAQMLLDQAGFPSGFFGPHHDAVLQLLTAVAGPTYSGAQHGAISDRLEALLW